MQSEGTTKPTSVTREEDPNERTNERVKGVKGDKLYKDKIWGNLKRFPLRRSDRKPRKSSRLIEEDGRVG